MSSQGNSSGKAAEFWDFGIRLDEAWFHLASREDQDRFRNSDQAGRSPNSVEIGLRIDLQARLESGELIAAGIEAGPAAHNGPIMIGKHFFSESAKIDWDTGALFSLGISFLSLRIGGNSSWPEIADCVDHAKPIDFEPVGETEIATAGAIGRPNVYNLLVPIINELQASNELSGKSVKQIHGLIRKYAKIKYPDKFISEDSPDRKTIKKALTALGKRG